MNTAQIEDLLSSGAEEALETMFFTASLEPPDSFVEMPADCVCARMKFQTTGAGTFWLGIEPETARRIAANLTGVEPEELSSGEAEQTVCELANIICGSMLSKTETTFRLNTPELVSVPDKPTEQGSATYRRCIHSELGNLFLSLKFAE